MELFTQRGGGNLSFALGEKIIFFISLSKPGFVRIFSKGTDGYIYQIFPNLFRIGNVEFGTDRLVAIPAVGDDFDFTVKEPLGNEVVKVCASERRLPDLPGIEVGPGFKRIVISAEEIHKSFLSYASEHNISICQDSITITTMEGS